MKFFAAILLSSLFGIASFATEPVQVEFVTDHGNFVVELNAEKAPITVANFLSYTDRGFYNGLVFHRVMKDFVVQGGGFQRGESLLELKTPEAPIVNESTNGLSNLRGTIGMARIEDPDSANSQFYFNTVDNTRLDYQSEEKPGYAVFGKIVSGIEVLDRIREVEVADQQAMVVEEGEPKEITLQNVPNEDVVIQQVRRFQ